jgi:hypothetical protein
VTLGITVLLALSSINFAKTCANFGMPYQEEDQSNGSKFQLPFHSVMNMPQI